MLQTIVCLHHIHCSAVVNDVLTNFLTVFILFPFPDEEKAQAEEEAKDQTKSMSLNVVRLCFQANLLSPDGKFMSTLPSCVSCPIYDSSKFNKDLIQVSLTKKKKEKNFKFVS